ncbi:uncharacterized protein LOC110703325 [Chenopodium quinoa]|uniref:uncharacterized protein LOC110703325 n=1 Tax=Chenopodium quinoa TaxID=63459 RepID=UPI000B77D9DD|nr:uncharacterized protein LOC110703325 [Chenopodium quinoa]
MLLLFFLFFPRPSKIKNKKNCVRRKMRKFVSLRLTSLILAVFLLMHALRNSLAHAHQAKVSNALLRKNQVFARKELGESNNHVEKARKEAMVGGRKMMITHHEVQEDDHMATTKKNPTPVLSGNDQERNALKINSSVRFHDKSHNKLEKKATLSNTNKAKTTQDYYTKAKKDDESKRLLEAAKEIMKLMHKDYRGRGRPKRRPPINNHNPRH